MIREILVSLIIVSLILLGNFMSQEYTKNSVEELTKKLEVLKQDVSKEEFNDIYDTWKKRFNILAYYIEHNELEKVEAELVVLKGKIENENYIETNENLEKTIFLLNHIEDKYAFNLQNIF